MGDTLCDDGQYFWQGEKVKLRPIRIEDAEHAYLASLDSPSRQMLQLGVELPTSPELLRSSLEAYVGCKDVAGVILFTIDDLEGRNVGGLSFHTRSPKNGTFGFGVVVDRTSRGQGYARDAVRMLLRYAFWQRRYQKCNSACVHTNQASIALHRSLGFVEEARRRRQLFVKGRYYDDILFGLTREEFDAHEGASELSLPVGLS